MLPNGGTGEPDDYRPIVLLSVYYRTWAKARGQSFAKFLKAAGITPSHGPRAADALAYDLALRMAASIAGHAPTSGLALDWSKCYDHLVLDLLRLVGVRVGIPATLLTPMLQAYAQPRAVLLAGALAPERTPTAGLAPGCPRATDLLAIVILMYTSAMEDSAQNVKSRPYVQNLCNRASALNAKRVDSGLGKLWRKSVLSMSLRRRGLFVAASGVPSAMYGIAADPLSNSSLLALSAAAFSAIW
jgi:hypothetical protein